MTIATAPWPAYPQNLINYDAVTAVPDIWPIAIAKFGDALALHDPHSTPEVRVTFRDLYAQIQQFAAGMQALGILPNSSDQGDPLRVAIFADNSPRWMVADQGTMQAGAANVVRSSKADRDELLYMLAHSGSIGVIVEDIATLRKLDADRDSEFAFDPALWVVLLSDETPPTDLEQPRKVLNFSQLMALGEGRTPSPHHHDRTSLATLIYTSGTTGKPKGAMLTHGNLMQQISSFGAIIPITVGDKALCILPTWHAYERTCEYYLLSQGCTQIYTSIRYFKTDLTTFRPQATIGVPRLWESLYEGVQKSFRAKSARQQQLIQTFLKLSQTYLNARNLSQGLTLDPSPPSTVDVLRAKLTTIALTPLHALGDRLVYRKVREATGGQIKFFVSGGGSLARHIDHFFAIVGINLLVGYGLTETAPVLAVRRIEANIPGASGPPIRDTELKIIDPETRQTLPRGDRGLVLARGPQIMRGYFRNPEATAKAIDPEGWFDTGDLGCLNHNNHIILTGRAKDTIVLSNGENIEPQPLEDACLRSPYIDQIMIVGQDQKQLGALIVPNFEAIVAWATEQGLTIDTTQTPPLDLDTPDLIKLLRREIDREVRDRPGFRADDRIGPIRLIAENFSIENGQMTQTLKIKRPVVTDRYQDMITTMFD
ncbi:MAG: long-chain fatty acid--CoA ligase [Oscillatoriales cyanobacterium]|nr:MAG: long-chain fatty acid--CoA ligase [Oscillatoriales cyanobacterium]